MKNTLTITIYSKELSSNEVEDLIKKIFNERIYSFELPINKEIINQINDSRGKQLSYQLFIEDDNYEKTLFDLLIKLEDFGIDWKIRRPIKLFDDKYTFVASLFPEFGIIIVDGIQGITVILEEGKNTK